ncbi:MAG: hypothetical protein GF346_07500 [Candidatus Eisenbacteria bacterium]|nr:hypothetical protein [Candidatus Eisenbacteria bacterium]
MREGRESVVEWLEENGDGVGGYAKSLLECRQSNDPRVVLGALKLEAQLREWFTEGGMHAEQVNVDQRAIVITPDALRTMLHDRGVADALSRQLEDVAGSGKDDEP